MGLAAAACLVDAFVVEPRRVEVTHHEVSAPVSQRIRIVHLTDLHMGRSHRYHQRWLREVEAAQPDLIVVTGDLVTPSTDPRVVTEWLDQLEAPEGVWVVRGNWELWMHKLQRPDDYDGVHATLLLNEWVDTSEITVVGFDDPHEGTLEVPDDLPPPEARRFTLGLVHSPVGLDEVDGNVDLLLAGHSHAGQFRLPFLGALWVPPGTGPYVEGWFASEAGTRMYVSRGLGMSILPGRFFCLPEIAVIDLVPEQ